MKPDRADRIIDDAKRNTEAHAKRVQRADRVAAAILGLDGRRLTAADVIRAIDAALGARGLDAGELLLLLAEHQRAIDALRNRKRAQLPRASRLTGQQRATLTAAIEQELRTGWRGGWMKRLTLDSGVSAKSVRAFADANGLALPPKRS